jgi:hypothetical protein
MTSSVSLKAGLGGAACLFGRAGLGDDPAAQAGYPAASIRFLIVSRHIFMPLLIHNLYENS